MLAMATFTESGLELYPITVERYHQMAEQGIFDEDDRVELLRGVITAVSKQGDPHRRAVVWLTAAFGPTIDWTRFSLLIQLGVSLPALDSEPEPDVAIVASPPPSDREAIPVLAVEVSDSSVRYDLRVKLGIYAEAGIPEYWVIDVPAQVVRVHRNPSGDRYLDVSTRLSGELATLTAEIPPIDVGALLAAIGPSEDG